MTTTLPIAVEHGDERSIVRARWGFPVGPRPVGNARDDKLLVSKLWSSMLGKDHCLIAATGIYEMIKVGDRKQSYWFRRRDGRPIVMPGLASARNLKGEGRLCCAIITTEPNEFFGRYHGRQVCALEKSEVDGWMSANDPAEAVTLVHAPPEDAWEAVPVDDRIFGKGRRELEDLVPIAAPERWDGGSQGAPTPKAKTLDDW